MKIGRFAWIAPSIVLAGCVSCSSSGSPLDAFHGLLAQDRFCASYLLWPKVEQELQGIGEGAAGAEYNRLVARTASMGQKDWARILQSPSVSRALKDDLRAEIDEERRIQ